MRATILLYNASIAASDEVAKALIRDGADFDFVRVLMRKRKRRTRYKECPKPKVTPELFPRLFYEVIRHGHSAVVKVLITHCADLKCGLHGPITALQTTVIYVHPKIFEFLLSQGADHCCSR